MTLCDAIREALKRLGKTPEQIETGVAFADSVLPKATKITETKVVKGCEEEFIQAMIIHFRKLDEIQQQQHRRN